MKLVAALWALQASRTRQFRLNRNIFEFTSEGLERAFPGAEIRAVNPRGQMSSTAKIVELLLGPTQTETPRFGELMRVLLQDSRYPTVPFSSPIRLAAGGVGRALKKVLVRYVYDLVHADELHNRQMYLR